MTCARFIQIHVSLGVTAVWHPLRHILLIALRVRFSWAGRLLVPVPCSQAGVQGWGRYYLKLRKGRGISYQVPSERSTAQDNGRLLRSRTAMLMSLNDWHY